MRIEPTLTSGAHRPMRAAAATGHGVDLIDVAPPVPAAGQVLAVPLATGICGSDLHLVEAYDGLGPEVSPIVLGHEFCARVVDTGPGGDPAGSGPRRVRPGTRVVSVPYALGPSGPEPLGLSTVLPGGFGEQMVLDEARVLLVPDELPDHVAALTEPLAVGVHAVAVASPDPGDACLVVGCGPIGLAVLAALKAEGHGPVVAADFSAARRRRAEAMGADMVLDPARSSPYGHWGELGVEEQPPSPLLAEAVGGPRRVVAFECVGVPGVLPALLDGVPRHSQVVVVGACIRPESFTPAAAIVKEVTMSFVFAYRPPEFVRALHLLASGRVDGEPLVTGHVDLSGVPSAFEALGRPEEHVKIVVSP